MWPLRNGKEIVSRTVRDMKEGVGEVFTVFSCGFDCAHCHENELSFPFLFFLLSQNLRSGRSL